MKKLSPWLGVMPVLSGLLLLAGSAAAGTWTPVVAQAPDNIDTMILLSDGTVMAASGTPQSGNIGNAIYRLTPDAHGSYANGTWTTLAPMIDTRLYYATEVLQDGRVFVAGGEYGSGGNNAEIYDPIQNSWKATVSSGQQFIDCESRLLPDGDVFVSPVIPNPPGSCIIYHVATDTWTPGGTLVRGFTLDEASWIKLPDDSILTLDLPGTGTNSERYIPGLNQWVDDATLPGSPWDFAKFEMGAGFLLPDGRGFFLGSSGTNVFYTPSGTTSPGSFTLGPNTPNSQGTPDAPGAMMVTGNILCAVGPNGYVGGSSNYPGPSAYLEFDPVALTFTDVGTPTGATDPDPPFIKRMLDLPDGTVLVSDSNPQLYIYKPAGAPLAAGKPTIIGITPNPGGSFHLVGTLLNGISEGAQYGDDAQGNSNYPLIRLTDANGVTYYLRTHDWSSTSVATGTKTLSTEFTVPPNVPAGTYSLVVAANGIASDPVSFTANPVPNLVVSTNVITGGNNNGVIDADECNFMQLVITNSGLTNATTVTGKLSTTTPGVALVQTTVSFPDVPGGGASTNQVPFEVSTSPSFICGTPINFSLTITSDQITVTRAFTVITGTNGVPLRFDSTNLTLIAAGPQGSSSPIVVSNIASALKKVTVSAFVSDQLDFSLTLQLIAPDGTVVLLTKNNGSTGQNYGSDCADADRTTFDDSATTSINSGFSPFVGTFQPVGLLGTFIGKSGTNINGIWQLNAIDQFGFGNDAIDCWSLFLTPAACTDGGGQCPGVDLSLGMTALPNPVSVQSQLTYNISVTNNGPDTATAVAVSQVLPASVSFVSASSSQGSVSHSGSSVSANLGTLAIGSVATVTVVVTPTAAGTAISTATVGSQQQELNPADNSATVSTVVRSITADLSVVLTAAPNPVLLGSILTYTATVVNNGPAIATNVVVTNTLPLNVGLNSVTVSQGSASTAANLVLASLGNLNPGSNATVVMKVQPLVLGSITASSAVSSSVADPASINNFSTVNVTVTPASDLALTLSGPSSVVLGSNITYQLTVVNQGPSPATSVSLKDTVPANVIFLSATNATIGASTPTFAGGIVSCLVSNLAVNASTTLTIVGATTGLTNLAPVTVVDTGSVSGGQADPITNNNSASLSTLVTFPTINVTNAGFLLEGESFQPTNGLIEPGETVTMLLLLKNLGNIDTSNSVTATLLSSNGVTPVGSQVQNYGLLTASGSAVGKLFTFVANGVGGGTITANLAIQNGTSNLPVPLKFTFTLAASKGFTNANNIIIPDHGEASPYPSTNTVSGVTGLTGKVTVTLTNVNHTFPDDIDMLLVGPLGQSVLLMSHAGGNGVLTNTSLTFDQSATQLLSSNSQILSGSYQPSGYGSVSFPSSNSPAPPYGADLTVFNGLNPNGAWRLFVFDSSPGDQGVIVGGWSLNIISGTQINPVADVGVTGVASPSSVIDGANLTYTFTITNKGPNIASTVLFTNVLPANATFVSATNNAHVASTVNNGVVSFTLNNLSSGSNVVVTIVVVPTTPGTQTSVATVTGSGSDPDQSNNSATVTTTATEPSADISLAMTGPTNAIVSSNFVYALSVTNNGPGVALNVAVTNPLNGLTLDAASSSSVPGAVPFSTNGSAICVLGNLNPGVVATISFVMVPTTPGTITNAATANTASVDANSSNNTASVITVIQAQAPQIVAAGARLFFTPPNGTLVPGQSATVSLQLANIGTADTADLVATLLVTNGVVVSSGTQDYGVLAHGGPALGRSFTFTPSGGNNGTIGATLQLNNGGSDLGTVVFNFNLPGTNGFANSTSITIPDHGPAAPYPATIVVSNVAGVVTKATVTLSNFNHQFPNDVEIMVVSPSGQNTVLMSGVGGGLSASNLVLTFDDAAGTTLPNGQLASGTFKPTTGALALAFPQPAPSQPYGSKLTALNGSPANGTWSLFVLDNSPGDNGNIGQGWSLNLVTVSPVNGASDLGVALASPVNSVFLGTPFTYTVTVTNSGPADASNVILTNSLPPGVSLVSASIATIGGPNNTWIFNVGPLPVGSSTSFTTTLTTATAMTVNDSINVGADQTDLNQVNNFAITPFAVSAAPKLLAKASTSAPFSLTLSLNGPPGVYAIVSTTNVTLSLSNWTVVGLVTNTTGSFQFTDTNTTGSKKFYRALFTP